MSDLPETGNENVKFYLVGLLTFLAGAAVGAGSFYYYSTKVLIPKYKSEMISEMFSTQSPEWGDFFKKAEEEKAREEYNNPFEGASEEVSEDEYVNPFDVIE